MDGAAKSIVEQANSADRGRRFLWVCGCFVAVTAIIVASVNLVAYRYMLRADNQAIVQLLSGWGRMYKPILYDEIKPNVAVYGASWARDAFDPIATGKLLGKKVFNHAVSGATQYETRRFGESSLDNPELQAAIINLDTFYHSPMEVKTRYGFDESILDTDPAGNPNYWVGLKRTYSLALAGWAVAANLELISAIVARDRGAAKSDYLRAYQQADHSQRQVRMDLARQRIFPDTGQPGPSAEKASPRPEVATPADLGPMIDGFCAHGVDVYAYFTPSHMRRARCDTRAADEFAALEFLRARQRGCAARIHLYDFGYPNGVTLEGVLAPVKASQYYRPDGHPRPTVGLLMAASMFGRDYPTGTPAAIRQDFGVELLSRQDAGDWLLEKAARCKGDWGAAGFGDFTASLNSGE